MLIAIVIGLSLLVVILPSVDTIVADPDVRWAVLILVVVAVGFVVLRQAAVAEPGKGMRHPPRPRERSRGRLERLSETIGDGGKKSRYSQMLAVIELRNAFRERVMALRGCSRGWLNDLVGDRGALHRVIGNRDLEDLLTRDIRGAYDIGSGMEGEEFMDYMGGLVVMMEEWK